MMTQQQIIKNANAVPSGLVKPRISLYDRNFTHATSCSNGDLKIYPRYFDWDRSHRFCNHAVFVDGSYTEVHKSEARVKIWMLLEPPSVSSVVYEMACNENVRKRFDYILTFDKSLLSLDEKFVYYPAGGCWIDEKDRIVHAKTKDISIIASEKNFTVGHRMRHEIIRRTQGRVDVFGRGYKFVQNKADALKDYRFSIVIENCQLDGYFTEKLIDCFTTATIPIYYGSQSIKDVFVGTGIETFNSADEFVDLTTKGVLAGNATELYNHRFASVTTNYVISRNYVNTEDWLWLNLFQHLME